MKRVLVLDGGGCKGIMQAVVLEAIEKGTGKQIFETFDLIVGSSVGAILGGLMATGKMPATDALETMRRIIPKMFARQWLPPWPKYTRKPLSNLWHNKIGIMFKMHECRTKFMCTSVNICDDRTHYFKSWEPKDGELTVHECITRSYAAPLFFGSWPDELGKAVWLDGGTTLSNCPLMQTVIECLRQGWTKERLHILSIGTGQVDNSVPYEKAVKYKTLRQLGFFADIAEGGGARRESVKVFAEATKSIDVLMPSLSFQRLDCFISKKIDKLDGAIFIDDYLSCGMGMRKDIDWNPLR